MSLSNKKSKIKSPGMFKNTTHPNTSNNWRKAKKSGDAYMVFEKGSKIEVIFNLSKRQLERSCCKFV